MIFLQVNSSLPTSLKKICVKPLNLVLWAVKKPFIKERFDKNS